MVVHCGRGRLSGAAWSHLPSCWCDTVTALSTISNVASGSLWYCSRAILCPWHWKYQAMQVLVLSHLLFRNSFLWQSISWQPSNTGISGSLSRCLLFLAAFSGSFIFLAAFPTKKLGSTSTLPPFPTYSGSSSLVGDRIMYLFGNVKIILKHRRTCFDRKLIVFYDGNFPTRLCKIKKF